MTAPRHFCDGAEVQRVLLALVGDGVDQRRGEVRLGDRVAGRALALAQVKVHKGRALVDHLQLAAHRLEKGGGAHDGVAHVLLRAQLLLEVLLRVLELQRVRVVHLGRFDTEGREQNEVAGSGGAGGVEAVERGLVVDGERVLLRARPAREAADHHVDLG